jgi:hypothetical protein
MRRDERDNLVRDEIGVSACAQTSGQRFPEFGMLIEIPRDGSSPRVDLFVLGVEGCCHGLTLWVELVGQIQFRHH